VGGGGGGRPPPRRARARGAGPRHQAAGRGRAGRVWETPPGVALTASVVLRPSIPIERWSWLSQLGGLAVARAVARRTGLAVALKWPNDVLVVDVGDEAVPGWGADRKVAGILAEVVHVPGPAGSAAAAAVLGFGLNVHQRPEQLPVPWATSLAAAGAPVQALDLDALLESVGRELGELLEPWEAAGGDASRSGLAAEIRRSCATIGRRVTVALPGGGELTGRADGIDDDGALLVVSTGAGTVRVTVGDVGHVRAPGG
jgi:BirA family biotin operon repressor/biotin-[acetyl-CoA-carboxylase] ligase